MYKIMKILLPIISYLSVVNSEGISCVQCSATRERRVQGILPCTEFDWSQKYVTECPKSTLCYKKSYTLPLGNGEEIQSIERGCAPQSQDVQTYNRAIGEWQKTEVIEESVYKEGCFRAEDNGRPGQPAEYCFCSYWLCNKSSSFRELSYSLITLNVAGMLFCVWANH